MMIDWGIVIQLLSMASVAIGIYVAIRSDLAVMHEKFKSNDVRVGKVEQDVDKAHERIDDWYRREPRK